MPVIDGMYHSGADADPALVIIASKLENCPKFEVCYTCQNCADFVRCERLFHGLCNISYKHKLRPDEVDKYRQLFQQRIGVTI
jgi:hypothetical protein